MKSTSVFTGGNRERTFYYLLAFALFAAYFTGTVVLLYQGRFLARGQSLIFGFAQIRFLLWDPPNIISSIGFVIIAALVYAAFNLVQRYQPSPDGRIPLLLRAGLSVLAAGIFFALHTNFLNSDGLSYAKKLADGVSQRGFYATYDELLEFYIHSRFWLYTHTYLGWNVEQAYRVLSCLAGGAFVFLLLTYAPRLSPTKPFYAALLCLAGGYMQLFFGDVENYTMTAAWLMAYFFTSVLFLEKKTSIILPAVILAASMMFHLLAGFLLPSLLFLSFIAWKRGDIRKVFYAAGISALIIGLTFLFFHLNGLPISDLWYKSNATGLGGRYSMLAPFSVEYYLQLANLVFLLLPAWILILPLIFYQRLMLDEINMHLSIASLFMAGFVLLWHAYLGVYQDWNLFAPAALPASLLIWRSVLRSESLQSKFSPVMIFGWLAFLHSYSWIMANHFIVK